MSGWPGVTLMSGKIVRSVTSEGEEPMERTTMEGRRKKRKSQEREENDAMRRIGCNGMNGVSHQMCTV